MKKWFEYIGDDDFLPSKELLENYSKGRLSKEESHQVERWLSTSDWGDEVGDVLHSDLVHQISWDTHHVDISGVENMVNIIVAGIASIMMIVAFLLTAQLVDPSNKASINETIEPEEIIEDYIVPEVKAFKPVEVKRVRETINEFKQTTLTLLSSSQVELLPRIEVEKKEHEVERIRRKIVIQPIIEDTTVFFRPTQHKMIYNHGVKYILQFKCIDYYKEYLRKREVVSGTSVELGDHQKEQWFSSIQVHHFPVDKILKEAFTYFYQRDYSNTIRALDQLTKKFPEDLNAKFYKALCFYKLGEIDDAIRLLQEVAEADINVFNEEAEWYLVKCHIADQDPNMAKNMLELIVASNGFYTQKAKELLKEL